MKEARAVQASIVHLTPRQHGRKARYNVSWMVSWTNAVFRALAVATLGICLSAGSTRAQAPLELLVLGDSLSDTGNLFALTGQPPSPYHNGRFSNGPVWPELLAADLAFEPDRVLNLAVGGATTGRLNIRDFRGGGVLDQLDALVAAPRTIDAETFVVVWAGANDLFPVLVGQVSPQESIEAAAENTATVLVTLIALGARNIWVANIPSLGRIPELLAIESVAPGSVAAATGLTIEMNRVVEQVLTAVESHTGVPIGRLDAFDLFEEIAADPDSFGIDNVTDPCLAADFSSICDDPSTQLFWDGVHPTTAGHRILKDFFVAQAVTHFVRGDCDGDGNAGSVADGVFLLRLLAGAESAVACPAACDANTDGELRVDDAVRLLRARFQDAPPPVTFPVRGCEPVRQPSDRALGCARELSFCG